MLVKAIKARITSEKAGKTLRELEGFGGPLWRLRAARWGLGRPQTQMERGGREKGAGLENVRSSKERKIHVPRYPKLFIYISLRLLPMSLHCRM